MWEEQVEKALVRLVFAGNFRMVELILINRKGTVTNSIANIQTTISLTQMSAQWSQF